MSPVHVARGCAEEVVEEDIGSTMSPDSECSHVSNSVNEGHGSSVDEKELLSVKKLELIRSHIQKEQYYFKWKNNMEMIRNNFLLVLDPF